MRREPGATSTGSRRPTSIPGQSSHNRSTSPHRAALFADTVLPMLNTLQGLHKRPTLPVALNPGKAHSKPAIRI